jgi:hypothetical protein
MQEKHSDFLGAPGQARQTAEAIYCAILAEVLALRKQKQRFRHFFLSGDRFSSPGEKNVRQMNVRQIGPLMSVRSGVHLPRFVHLPKMRAVLGDSTVSSPIGRTERCKMRLEGLWKASGRLRKAPGSLKAALPGNEKARRPLMTGGPFRPIVYSAEKPLKKSSNAFFCSCSVPCIVLMSAWYFSICVSC